MKKIILIVIAVILLFVVVITYSCSSCNKTPVTKSAEENSSDDVTTNQLSSNNNSESISIEDTTVPTTTLNNETTTALEIKEESTTIDDVKEETTTKPVVQEEKTTVKPNKQTTSKKENQTKPVEEQTTKKTTVNPNQFTYEIWQEAVTYMFSEDIETEIEVYTLPSKDSEAVGRFSKGGMTVEITGICKENGWYRIEFFDGIGYVSNEYKVIKKAFPEDSFEDYASIEEYIDALYINNPYTGTLYLFYPGESSVSGEEVKIYHNKTIENLLYIYSHIMPYVAVNYYDPQHGYYGDETIEELLKLEFGEDMGGWTVQEYKNGEVLAKYYGLDFHSDVEYYKEWGYVDYKTFSYEEMNVDTYWYSNIWTYWSGLEYSKLGNCIYEEPMLGADVVCAEECCIPFIATITKRFKNWDWYEVSYECPVCKTTHIGYINITKFEEYLEEHNEYEEYFTKTEQWERNWYEHHDPEGYLEKYVYGQQN